MSFGLNFDGTNTQVRESLIQLRAHLQSKDVNATDIGSAELVVAEVLNNIVEHAFNQQTDGWIEMTCTKEQHGWQICIHDNGRAMPRERLPTATMPNLDTLVDDMPEGGFGWAIVQLLAKDFHYSRISGQNNLTFMIPNS